MRKVEVKKINKFLNKKKQYAQKEKGSPSEKQW